MRSELFGRGLEMRRLQALLDDALGGRLRLALISGEPGIGKTRLAEEVTGQASARGTAVGWGRSAETEGAPPYWAWRQVIRGLAAVAGDRVHDVRTDELAKISPEVAAPTSPSAEPPEEPEQRFALFDTVGSFLRSVGADGLVVVLDDLHAADEPTLQLLLHLIRWHDDAPILVLGTYRETDASAAFNHMLPELIGDPASDHLSLTGLGSDAVARILEAQRDEQVTPEVAERVHGLTGGNAFFVHEIGRALESFPRLPTTVMQVIAKRLDGLSTEARAALHAASVIGREFDDAVVANVLDVPVLTCLPALEESVAAGFLEALAAPGRHRFVHALLRDAVEADIGAPQRVELHLAAAEAIEDYFAADLDPHLSDLARHWAAASTAGAREKAARWAQRAADYAMATMAYEEAARLYRVALQSGSGALDEAGRARLLLALARADYAAGEFGACITDCEEAAEAGRKLDDPDIIAEAALVPETLGEPQWSRTVRTLCEDALARIADDRTAIRARLLAQLSHANLYVTSDTSEIEAQSREALRLAEDSDDLRALVAALRARQAATIMPEGVDERAEFAERMIDAGTRLRSTDITMWGHLWRFQVFIERGDLASARDETERVALCAERLRQPTARWHLLRCRGTLAQAFGRFDEALAIAEEVGALGARSRMTSIALALKAHISHHTGIPSEEETPPGVLEDQSPFGTIARVGETVRHLESGRSNTAAALYRAQGPARGWRYPPFLRLPVLTLGVLAAAALGEQEDLETLYATLLTDRGRHAVSGGGAVTYGGPAELYLGIAAARLGLIEDAAGHLRTALDVVRRNGARAHAVEAGVELATLLADSDPDEARELARTGSSEAHALGMEPYAARADALLQDVPEREDHPLTPREREVAGLVAKGLTNREIAEALVLSERTAQNHVQHILTKLGFSTRAQIAAWATRRTLDHGSE